MMRLFVRPIILVFFILVSSLSPLSYGQSSRSTTISAEAVIFSNSTKVKRLYGKNVHGKISPASTVKIVTALVVFDRLSLDQFVTVSKNATYPQPTKIYVKPGEKYRVRDLLYAILIRSANDASVVLAEAVAGTEAKFVKLMNDKAREIGCRSTRFANAHGLPTSLKTQYSTAYDMYLIFRAAIKYPFFVNAIRMNRRTIYSQAGRKVTLRSNNKILSFNWKRKLYGKTGYTRMAGACFVGYLKKGTDDLIIAIFNCKSGRRWKEIKHIVSRYGGIDL